MTPEQVTLAIAVAALAVAIQFIRLIGDTVNDLLRARNKKTTAKLEGEAIDVEAKTEAEKMGIQYMQQLVLDNVSLRTQKQDDGQEIARLNERISLREESLGETIRDRETQLTTQSQLKTEAIIAQRSAELKASKAEQDLSNCLSDTSRLISDLAKSTGELASKQGAYEQLAKDIAERRDEWHADRTFWQSLETVRQSEVMRSRFILRHLTPLLSNSQLTEVKSAVSQKGFDFDQFVLHASTLEIEELEKLRKENIELKGKLNIA